MNETTEREEPAAVGVSPLKAVVSGHWSPAYNAANLDVAKCEGALAQIEAARKRLRSTRRPQMWMLHHLDETYRRVHDLLGPLVRKRDELYRR